METNGPIHTLGKIFSIVTNLILGGMGTALSFGIGARAIVCPPDTVSSLYFLLLAARFLAGVFGFLAGVTLLFRAHAVGFGFQVLSALSGVLVLLTKLPVDGIPDTESAWFFFLIDSGSALVYIALALYLRLLFKNKV